MNNIVDILRQASADVLDHLGQSIWLNGVEYFAVFDEQLFSDDSGYRKELIFSLKPEDVRFFTKGNIVIVNEQQYQIRYIPEYTHQETLVEIEVKHVKT